MQKFNFKNKKGFTVVETMVSVSLFLVVVIYGMGALMNANLLHNKSQNLRSIVDNLSFIMEDLSRNLRMGGTFHCDVYNVGAFPSPETISQPRDCSQGSYIAFECSDPLACLKDRPEDQWAYRLENKIEGGGYNISKSTDGGAIGTWTQLNSNEIFIKSASFSVLGSTPGGDQPIAFIRLVGEIRYKNVVTPFSLQTSSSQRLMDVSEI